MKVFWLAILLFLAVTSASVSAQTFYNMVGATENELISLLGPGQLQSGEVKIRMYPDDYGNVTVYRFISRNRVFEAVKYCPTNTKYQAKQLYGELIRTLGAEGFVFSGEDEISDTECTLIYEQQRIILKVEYNSGSLVWQLVARAS